MSIDFRFLTAAFLLAGGAVVFHAQDRLEKLPTHQSLSGIPTRLGPWSGSDQRISEEVLNTLGKGDFLARRYSEENERSSPIDLFIAYFPSQRTGDTLHSPLNCLPGSGWSVIDARRIALSVPGQPSFQINRDLVAKGSDRALVLYWYWSHGRGVASEYAAKFYLVEDSIRLHRSDGALIRISTPVRAGQTASEAERELARFAERLISLIDGYIPG